MGATACAGSRCAAPNATAISAMSSPTGPAPDGPSLLHQQRLARLQKPRNRFEVKRDRAEIPGRFAVQCAMVLVRPDSCHPSRQAMADSSGQSRRPFRCFPRRAGSGTLITTLKIGLYGGARRPDRPGRRGRSRDELAAQLPGAHPPRRSRPDDPGPRRRRLGAGLARARASANGCATTRSPTIMKRCDGRGRGQALPLASRRRSARHRPRASRSASQRGRWTQGGSTITQQLARNIFLTNSRTFGRKIREAHPGAGARAALHQGPDPRALSQPRLFRRRRLRHRRRLAPLLRPFGADQLSLSEAAIIAGLVKAPSNYSPTADAEAARQPRLGGAST